MALLRRFVVVAAVLFLVDWALGVGRFSWPSLESVFAVINFPWSVPFLWLDGQSPVWWRDYIGIDDEIGGGLAFLLMVSRLAC